MQLLPFERCDNLRVSADVARQGDRLEFTYQIDGEVADIVFPPFAPPERTDGLWQSTCFEAFIGIGETSYTELNFAPSRQWAAYRFTDYRDGMSAMDIAPPQIAFGDSRLVASIGLEASPGAPFNLTAVIAHRSGARSYWSLLHPTGNRPDFHVRDCFVGKLP